MCCYHKNNGHRTGVSLQNSGFRKAFWLVPVSYGKEFFALESSLHEEQIQLWRISKGTFSKRWGHDLWPSNHSVLFLCQLHYTTLFVSQSYDARLVETGDYFQIASCHWGSNRNIATQAARAMLHCTMSTGWNVAAIVTKSQSEHDFKICSVVVLKDLYDDNQVTNVYNKTRAYKTLHFNNLSG